MTTACMSDPALFPRVSLERMPHKSSPCSMITWGEEILVVHYIVHMGDLSQVAVLGRKRTLFCREFQLHPCVQSAAYLNFVKGGAHTCCIEASITHVLIGHTTTKHIAQLHVTSINVSTHGYGYLGVSGGDVLVGGVVLIVRMGGVGANDVHVAGDDEGEDLFACPEGLGFVDGRLGHLAVPRGQPHQQLHYILLVCVCVCVCVCVT